MNGEIEEMDRVQSQMTVEPYTTESALRIRLDTAPLKYQIQLFLEGKHESLDRNTDGTLTVVKKQKGSALMNEVGIQRIMSYLEAVINSQVVQGNLKIERYETFMMRVRQELAKHLFVNMYNYEIDEKEYPFIVDMVCNMVELFVSRVIDNWERRSYAGFMFHAESSQAGMSQQKKSGVWDRLVSWTK